MISKKLFDKLQTIKGQHRIGVQIPNGGLPQEEYYQCFNGKGYPELGICDADDPDGKKGIPYTTPQGLYDWLYTIGNCGESMESLFEFEDIETLGEVVLLADEVRHE